ncbi:MAG TPA: sulfurtransferase [Acidobacteriota bacterium]|nr:sulfurtransferase [Acidobacteriota bacterium]
MSLKTVCIALAALSFLTSAVAKPRDIEPIVSTEWLALNLKDPQIALIDIRTAAQYQKGHIPGSINVPLSEWAIAKNGLTLELPSDESLRALVGKSGMTRTSKVVVVTRTETDFGRADATRVAWTCQVAGLKDVAVLDGGFTKWARENRAVSVDVPVIRALTYSGSIDRSSVAGKEYVLGKRKSLIIADNRTPEDYFGITAKPGHISGAVNLPTPWVFNSDGTFKSQEELRSMASGVLGDDKSKEIVVYCGVGGYASTWWFLLTQILGYQNVKLYDGSFEEWTKDPKAPVQSYRWH